MNARLAAGAAQMTLDFEPSLLERHRTAMDCIRQQAYTHRNPLKTIAADMDLSESDLSRKLTQNPNDTRRFSVDDLEAFIQATGDTTIVAYLAVKYLADDEMRQTVARRQLMKQLPDVLALIRQVCGSEEK